MLFLWIGFGLLIAFLLAMDLGVFHRKAHNIGQKEAIRWTAVWVSVGLLFSIPVYFIYQYDWLGITSAQGDPALRGQGLSAVSMYLACYLLEESLSIDNIFVIAIVLTSFGIAPKNQHRILYWGILGAIFMRAAMIFGGVWLLDQFTWLFYFFGGYLVYTGIKLVATKQEDEDPTGAWYVRLLKKLVPIHPTNKGPAFFVKENGKTFITLSFLALITVELADVVFAVDSIPAVLSLTSDPFLVLTSNIFAILGLRSLYFVLASMMGRFVYLKHSLAAILVFIGGKMVLHSFIKVPVLISLAVIVALFAAGIYFSLRKTKDLKIVEGSLEDRIRKSVLPDYVKDDGC